MRALALLSTVALALSLGACNTSSPLGALNQAATISFGPSTTGSITPATDYNPNTDERPQVFVYQGGQLLGWGRLTGPAKVFLTKFVNPAEGTLTVKLPDGRLTQAVVAGEDGNLTTLALQQ